MSRGHFVCWTWPVLTQGEAPRATLIPAPTKGVIGNEPKPWLQQSPRGSSGAGGVGHKPWGQGSALPLPCFVESLKSVTRVNEGYENPRTLTSP